MANFSEFVNEGFEVIAGGHCANHPRRPAVASLVVKDSYCIMSTPMCQECKNKIVADRAKLFLRPASGPRIKCDSCGSYKPKFTKLITESSEVSVIREFTDFRNPVKDTEDDYGFDRLCIPCGWGRVLRDDNL